MSDPRLTPANARVAAAHLQGLVQAKTFAKGTVQQVKVPIADIWDATQTHRQRQLLRGEKVRVFETHNGMNFVQSVKDGYVGYVTDGQLGAPDAPTHMIAVQASHIYQRPDVTCADALWHSFGTQLQVIGDDGMFFSLAGGGYVPKLHLRPMNKPFTDPVTVAQMLFGVPYLWGGNSAVGIDCSGLVQAGYLSCGQLCPADSDLQMQALGQTLPDDMAPQRGDLYFWKGHVAMAVDDQTLIHANGYHMAVAYEPIADTVQRMEAQGDGPLLARKRVSRPTE